MAADTCDASTKMLTPTKGDFRPSPAARGLYRLARLLYNTDLGHSKKMKAALQSPNACANYRRHELSKIVAAAERYGVDFRNQVLVDLGCADGSISRQYADVGASSVIGVDIDTNAIAAARANHACEQVTFVTSQRDQIPIAASTVDVIVSYDVFEHLAQPTAILSECYRILRPGGKLLVGTWGWYHPFAPHLWATMPVPWAHVCVSERSLLQACRMVYNSPWYIPDMHDFDKWGNRKVKYTESSISKEYLNKYRIRDFQNVFDDSGFDAQVHLVPFGSWFAKWTYPLLFVPYIREFVTGYVWIVAQRPQ